MRKLLLGIGFALLAGCMQETSSESLTDRLSNSQVTLSNPNGDGGIWILQLRPDGTGTSILQERSRNGSEEITWRATDTDFCIASEPGGLMSSSGAEECIPAFVGGSRVTFGVPGSGFVISGTIEPL